LTNFQSLLAKSAEKYVFGH